MNTLVMKFGGTSVGTTTGLTQVLSIVLHEREQWERLILVVSALEGVTDALIEAAHLAEMGNQRGYRRIVANLRTRHLALIEELPLGTTERTALQADIDRLLFDMLDVYQGMSQHVGHIANQADAVDATIGVGEKLSARIIAALLRQNSLRSVALDSTALVVTDDVFGNATPDIPRTREQIAQTLLPLLQRQIVPVVTGFIGATKAGQPTTLGRGGSDYTASVIGVCTQASAIWIWTDVDGMMTADPRDIEGAKVIQNLTYEEVAELAYFGARVLHARMIGPIREERIPLHIKNVYHPQQSGTAVAAARPANTPVIKAVTSIAGIAIHSDRGEYDGHLEAILTETIQQSRIEADFFLQARSSTQQLTCLLIPTTAGPDAAHSIRLLLEDSLEIQFAPRPWSLEAVSILSIIGSNLTYSIDLVSTILKALSPFPILALAQGASSHSISVVVTTEHNEGVLATLHELALNNE
jgi:bifunctional aspartokinase / homoserine dehydrogenase 1